MTGGMQQQAVRGKRVPVYYLVKHFFGVGCRHTEASSGLDDGGSREAHYNHTYIPLQHFPGKCPGHNTKKDLKCENYDLPLKAAP